VRAEWQAELSTSLPAAASLKVPFALLTDYAAVVAMAAPPR
jgi:hypothetical protein